MMRIMIGGIFGSYYKGPRKDITGRKCPPKLKTGARNVKSVNVEETRSSLKEPRSSLSLLSTGGVGHNGHCSVCTEFARILLLFSNGGSLYEVVTTIPTEESKKKRKKSRQSLKRFSMVGFRDIVHPKNCITTKGKIYQEKLFAKFAPSWTFGTHGQHLSTHTRTARQKRALVIHVVILNRARNSNYQVIWL